MSVYVVDAAEVWAALRKLSRSFLIKIWEKSSENFPGNFNKIHKLYNLQDL